MTEGSRGVRCCMLFLVLLGNVQSETKIASPVNRPDSSARKHFERGKKLIENNCVDCMSGSQSGLEGGIREIKAALQAGYGNRKAAYELLSDAYANMITYTEKSQKEAKAYAAKRAQADRKLFEMDPNDPDVLARYENTLENDSDKIEILRRLLKIAPAPGSKFRLGFLLMKQHKVGEGLSLVRSAIETEGDAESVVNYVMSLIGQLNDIGCPLAGADEWQKQIHATFEKATNGIGDPNALPGFKKSFLAALDKNKCAGS
jgi:hypothetical protein